jgi:hypothetical protein
MDPKISNVPRSVGRLIQHGEKPKYITPIVQMQARTVIFATNFSRDFVGHIGAFMRNP